MSLTYHHQECFLNRCKCSCCSSLISSFLKKKKKKNKKVEAKIVRARIPFQLLISQTFHPSENISGRLEHFEYHVHNGDSIETIVIRTNN